MNAKIARVTRKKDKKNLFEYPLPKEILLHFANQVFTPLKQGQCVTTLWVAGGGKRFRLNYFLSEKKILQDIFKTQFDNILFVNIHPDEILELSSNGYLELILDKFRAQMEQKNIPIFEPQTKNPLRIIREYLLYLLSLDKEIIFLLNDFEMLLSFPPSIFANLESIIELNKKKIRCLILSHKNIVDEQLLLKMGNFKYAILRNVFYIPLFKDKEIDYLISYRENALSILLPEEAKQVLKEYVGGHPLLIKYGITNLTNTNGDKLKDREWVISQLVSDFELSIAIKEIWSSLNQSEKDIVIYVINTGTLPTKSKQKAKYLLETGILKIDKKRKVSTFGKLFDQVVQSEQPSYKLRYQEESSDISMGPISCSDKFTLQEFNVLKLLLMNEGKVVSRDQIAKMLWEKDYYDKYSDWAIDKVVSTIRKKLSQLGFSVHKLQTLKGRGFKLSS